MPISQRGIDPKLQKGWATAIQKQDKLRLTWFRNNEKRLNEIANKPPSREVPEEMKQEFKQDLIKNYQNVEKYPRIKTNEADPPVDNRAYQSKIFSKSFGFPSILDGYLLLKKGPGSKPIERAIRSNWFKLRQKVDLMILNKTLMDTTPKNERF